MTIQRLRTRTAPPANERRFTLLELLVVTIIVGILLAVAISSYLEFRGGA